VNSLDFSRDGELLLASTDDGTLELYNALDATYRPLIALPFHRIDELGMVGFFDLGIHRVAGSVASCVVSLIWLVDLAVIVSVVEHRDDISAKRMELPTLYSPITRRP